LGFRLILPNDCLIVERIRRFNDINTDHLAEVDPELMRHRLNKIGLPN